MLFLVLSKIARCLCRVQAAARRIADRNLHLETKQNNKVATEQLRSRDRFMTRVIYAWSCLTGGS
jgi:hypothetical protein